MVIYFNRSRPPMPQTDRSFDPQQSVPAYSKPSMTQNVIRAFQDKEGNLDVDKIMTVTQQVDQLYGQVSPLIKKFTKR